ncbi:glycosyltransferase [Nocardioides sp.]|uniref:glycosyltransferase n=1 Tax=Nocardioides sp. TaxID=35761 RepID=UPI003782D5FE
MSAPAVRSTTVSVLRDRVRRLRPVPPAAPAWQLPPEPVVVRPDLRVAVAGSGRLRRGLADQWHQIPADPASVRGADLLLVEVADGRVPGVGAAGDPLVRELLEAATAADVPVAVWVTSGRPPSGLDATAAWSRVLAAATVLHVADLADAWRALVPDARLLPPAAAARRGPRVERPAGEDAAALLVVSGASDELAAGPVAAVLAPGLAPVADRVDVLLLADDLPVRGVLPAALGAVARRGHDGDLAAAVAQAAVVVDGPRRSPRDTWAVLEAAAAGTPVVSLDGLPLPDGLEASRPATPAAVRAEVVARLHHPELADREALRQRRAVLDGHTFADRARTLLASLGHEEPAPPPPTVSAIVPTNREHEVDQVLANVGRQAHRSTELVLVLHGLDLPEAELQARARAHDVPQLEVVRAPGHLTLGACLNLGVDAAGGDLVAKMDDDNHYGTHYLSDLVAALDAQGAGIAGKWAHYVWLRSSGAVVLRYPDAEHTWARRIQGGSMLFAGDVVRELRFGDLPRAVDSDILDRAIAAGVPIWSADRFNFVSVRGEDRTAHTWTVEDATFLTAAGRLAFYGDPRSQVEV